MCTFMIRLCCRKSANAHAFLSVEVATSSFARAERSVLLRRRGRPSVEQLIRQSDIATRPNAKVIHRLNCSRRFGRDFVDRPSPLFPSYAVNLVRFSGAFQAVQYDLASHLHSALPETHRRFFPGQWIVLSRNEFLERFKNTELRPDCISADLNPAWLQFCWDGLQEPRARDRVLEHRPFQGQKRQGLEISQ
jgi:hypothetical protein